MKINGRVYKAVVRPAMKYEAKTWLVKKKQEKELDVAKMKMWMSSASKMYSIRNEITERNIEVEISKKAQERSAAVVWTYKDKRRGICREGSNLDGAVRQEAKR